MTLGNRIKMILLKVENYDPKLIDGVFKRTPNDLEFSNITEMDKTEFQPNQFYLQLLKSVICI